MLRTVCLLVFISSVISIPATPPPFHSESLLDSLPRSPICFGPALLRCESHADCSSSSSSCGECYGFVPGRKMSGMCGKPIAAFLSSSSVAAMESSVVPEQIRVAQGKTPSTLSVMWITPAMPASPAFAEVSSDLSGQSGWVRVEAAVKNYTAFCRGTLTPTYTYESGYIFTAVFDSLAAATPYVYRVGSGDLSAGGWSGLKQVTTLPQVGSQPGGSGFSIGIVGDVGQTAYSAQTLAHVVNDSSLAFVLHAGDMSYSDCNHKRWDSWGLMAEAATSSRPYMVIPGNHEIETDPIQNTTFLGYKYRFSMPEVQPTDDHTSHDQLPVHSCTPSDYTGGYDFGNSFYSFEAGPVHVLMLNSYTETDAASNQYKWVEQDLKQIDRQKTPWVVAMMHAPWYSTNLFHHNEKMAVAMKKNMEPLFFQYRVNIVFTGHCHDFEETFEVYNSETYAVGGAPVHVVIGDGGNREGHARIFLPKTSWSAFRNGNEFGHGKLTVFNATNAQFDWLRNVDPEMQVAHSINLLNDPAQWGKKEKRSAIAEYGVWE